MIKRFVFMGESTKSKAFVILNGMKNLFLATRDCFTPFAMTDLIKRPEGSSLRTE